MANYSEDRTPLDVCPYFDSDLVRYNDFISPYEFSEGGVRQRLFDLPTGSSQTSACLVKAGLGIRFMKGREKLTPAKVSTFRAGLLRFGWLGDVLAQSETALQQPPEDEGPATRKKVAMHSKILELGAEGSLPGPNTAAYEGSDQLESLGLISRGGFSGASS